VITIRHQYYSDAENWGLERIVFADGTVWDQAAINANAWIRGNADGNELYGAHRDETFDGGAGADYLTGGLGHDVFVLRPGGGSDIVTDFELAVNGQSGDLLQLAFPDLTSFSQVLGMAEQIGANTVISFGNGDSVTLLNIQKSQLSATDFRFVA
jgi:Ca2+-binding RTX toxin-like protein